MQKQTPEETLYDLLFTIATTMGAMTQDPKIVYHKDSADFTLQVNPHDQGRFIGKQGSIITALNTVFWWAGVAHLARTCGVKLLESENDNGDRRATPFKPNPKWDRKKISTFANKLLYGCFKNGSAGAIIEEKDEINAVVNMRLDKYLEAGCAEPNLAEAIAILIHAAGKPNGCNLTTNISWQ